MKCKDYLGNEFKTVNAMCDYYGVSPVTFHSRINSGWSLERALKAPSADCRKRACIDHKGNEFTSVKDMCKHYGISYSAYQSRVALGLSLQAVLETPVKDRHNRGVCIDHKGNQFVNLAAMCRHYGITTDTFNNREHSGWSLQRILETPTYAGNKKGCTDHLGNKFNSISDMCKYYGVLEGTFRGRIRRGISLKDALTCKNCTDHLGNVFSDVFAMCDYYGIPKSIFTDRLKHGWSLKKALETPASSKSVRCSDHYGNEFDSIQDLCAFYGKTYLQVDSRVKAGWSLKDALETPVKSTKCEDHCGRVFESKGEMCKYWGVSVATLRDRLKRGWSLQKALETPVVHSKRSKSSG